MAMGSSAKQLEFKNEYEESLANARESLRNVRRISEESIYGLCKVDSEKAFSLGYLRRRFATNLELELLFNRYTQRINRAYFSLYLLLQAFFGITHFIIVLTLNAVSNTLHVVVLDLVIYSLTGLISLIVVYLNEDTHKNHKNLLKFSTIAIFTFVFISDIAIPIYYNLTSISPYLRPTYTVHVLLACYLILNIQNNVYAFLLGAFTTICYMLTLAFVTYQNDEFILQRLGSDFTYMICINCFGICFRYANEMVKRRAFLDHRGCVELTLKLKFEREQEEQLMLSIIPEHILKDVRRDILNKIEYIEKMFKIPASDSTGIPYIREYDKVTILYADIVNYTAMTGKLPVKILVQTLNDLFSGFDDASEELNVLRIKFLGDCYYSVAGLPPNPAPNHAEACIDLGLRMISIIRQVREKRDLAIDMRIGIHSGKILSGLIGSTKWQFDIWSTDAFIANKMETAGEAGKVHITQQTLNLIKKTYNIAETNKGSTDANLIPFMLTTYLISLEPERNDDNEPSSASRKSIQKKLSVIGETDISLIQNTVKCDSETGENSLQKRTSLPNILDTKANNSLYHPARPRMSLRNVLTPVETIISRRPSGNTTLEKRSVRRTTPGDVKRRTAFMDNNIKQYFDRLRNTNERLKEAIDELPLSKYEQWFKVTDINPVLLIFKDIKLEKDYIKLPDPLFKYYLFMYVLLLIAVTVIQNLTLQQWEWESWIRYSTLLFIILFLLPLTWMQSLWSKYFASNLPGNECEPKNKIISLICRLSSLITSNVFIRTAIYLLLCGFFIGAVLVELIECKQNHDLNNQKMNFVPVVSLMLRAQLTNSLQTQCIIPWHMSHTLGLAILMCFSFLHIQIWVKLLVAAALTVFYSVSVWEFTLYYSQDSETFNYMMEPHIAHIISLVYLTITLHMLDRQTDYLNKLDYRWTVKLRSEQAEVNIMSKITTMLLKNILPIHVAELYLDVNRPAKEGLYTEEYKNVSVIFASSVDFYMDSFTERTFLSFINQIIKEFDLLLLKERQRPIEKIKVTNMTYMAACGLEPGRKDSCGYSNTSGEHVAVTIVKFAVDMILALNKMNRESAQECKLRIGICHGEVMAGVVGSKKPFYDIWGNTVNLASRMDSCGVAGKIQITKNTADVLENYGIKCEFRDFIYVKGKEHKVPTYFVALDENDQLIYQ